MKLNHECIRDLLLAIENQDTLEPLMDKQIFDLPELANYDKNTIIYTAQKLNEAGFLNGKFDFYLDGEAFITISSITYEGHSFLDSIRDEKVWRKTKEAASKVSSVSLPILKELGLSILKSQLGLP